MSDACSNTANVYKSVGLFSNYSKVTLSHSEDHPCAPSVQYVPPYSHARTRTHAPRSRLTPYSRRRVTGRYYARAVFDSRPEPLLTDDVDAVGLIVLSTAFRHWHTWSNICRLCTPGHSKTPDSDPINTLTRTMLRASYLSGWPRLLEAPTVL